MHTRTGAPLEIAPHLLTGCNHTLFGTPVALPFKLDELNEGRGERNPLFRSMANYCKLRRERRGPKCPPRSEHRPHLGRSQVFFAVLTFMYFVSGAQHHLFLGRLLKHGHGRP